MCNKTGIAFAERTLAPSIVIGRDVIEVGAYDVNGSVRPYVESLAPSSYLGVDIAPGPRVDRVLDAQELVAQLGGDSADIVITTEMLEHIRDWHTVVTNLKGILRPGGYLLVTTRSAGFPYHEWPGDFWRYEIDDFRLIFDDLEILALETDTDAPGVFLLARRPNAYTQRTPRLALYSMVTRRRQRRVTDAQIAWFRATWHVWFVVRWRIIDPVWMAIPAATQGHIKRAIGRG